MFLAVLHILDDQFLGKVSHRIHTRMIFRFRKLTGHSLYLYRIISKPIVQKSRETNVPAWLLLPTIGNAAVGAIFVFSPSSLLSAISGAEGAWIGIVYLVAGALFLVALLLGWYLSTFTIQNNKDKKTKNIAVIIFISIMAANTVRLKTPLG